MSLKMLAIIFPVDKIVLSKTTEAYLIMNNVGIRCIAGEKS